MSWSPGEAIVFRQIWQGRPLFAVPCVVISDEPGLLVTYLPERAPFGAVPGWPRPGGVHPWAHRAHWEGHGTLMLRRPGDRYSIWVFWQGEERRFVCWYVNLEQPYRRSALGDRHRQPRPRARPLERGRRDLGTSRTRKA